MAAKTPDPNSLDMQLFQAFKKANENVKLIQDLIARGAKPVFIDTTGNILHHLILQVNRNEINDELFNHLCSLIPKDIISELIKQVNEVKQVNEEKQVIEGLNSPYDLLRIQYDPNSKIPIAELRKYAGIIKFFIDNGIDPFQKIATRTEPNNEPIVDALYFAFYAGDRKLVLELLENKIFLEEIKKNQERIEDYLKFARILDWKEVEIAIFKNAILAPLLTPEEMQNHLLKTPKNEWDLSILDKFIVLNENAADLNIHDKKLLDFLLSEGFSDLDTLSLLLNKGATIQNQDNQANPEFYILLIKATLVSAFKEIQEPSLIPIPELKKYIEKIKNFIDEGKVNPLEPLNFGTKIVIKDALHLALLAGDKNLFLHLFEKPEVLQSISNRHSNEEFYIYIKEIYTMLKKLNWPDIENRITEILKEIGFVVSEEEIKQHLDLPREKYDLNIFKRFVEFGGNPNFTVDDRGSEPTRILDIFMFNNNYDLKIIAYLLSKGAKPGNKQNEKKIEELFKNKGNLKKLLLDRPQDVTEEVRNEFMKRCDPIVVIGAGLGGLLAAIKTAEKGYPVIVLEKRTVATRGMRVELKGESQDILRGLFLKMPNKAGIPTDPLLKKIYDNLGFHPPAVEIKDLQNALILIANTLYPYNRTNGMGINIILDATVSEINGDKQEITYQKGGSSSKSIKFSHCVAADGANRSFLSALKPGKYGMEIRKLERQSRQSASGVVFLEREGSVQMTTEEKEFAANPEKPTRLSIEHLDTLKELGWDKPYPPQAYLWSTKNGNKWYVAGEVPESFLKPENAGMKEKNMEKWGRTLLLLTKGIATNIRRKPAHPNPEKQAYRAEKQKLKTSCFEIELTYVVNPCLKLGLTDDKTVSEGYLVVIGDASKSAHFLLGHGANDAFKDAVRFANALDADTNVFNAEAFKELYAEELRSLKITMLHKESERQQEYLGFKQTFKKKYDALKEKIRNSEGILGSQIQKLNEFWSGNKDKFIGSVENEDEIRQLKQAINQAFNDKKIDAVFLNILALIEKCEKTNLKVENIVAYIGFLAEARDQINKFKASYDEKMAEHHKAIKWQENALKNIGAIDSLFSLKPTPSEETPGRNAAGEAAVHPGKTSGESSTPAASTVDDATLPTPTGSGDKKADRKSDKGKTLISPKSLR